MEVKNNVEIGDRLNVVDESALAGNEALGLLASQPVANLDMVLDLHTYLRITVLPYRCFSESWTPCQKDKRGPLLFVDKISL